MTIEAAKNTAPPTPPPHKVDNDPTQPGTVQSGTAAAAAQAALSAAKPIVNPEHRAAAGWTLANNKDVASKSGPASQAVADAGANARTAMNRTNLPPQQAEQVRNVVERLGNAIVDGKLEPHVNDTLRQHLYALATEPADSSVFKAAQAQMTSAADALQHDGVAPGTRMLYDPQANQPTGRSGLPELTVKSLDADNYYQAANGELRINNAKVAPSTLASTLKEAASGDPQSNQVQRQLQWQSDGTTAAPRSLGAYTFNDGAGFNHLLDNRNLGQLSQFAAGNGDARRVVIGDRTYSANDLKALDADLGKAADAHVNALREQHIASGQPAESFKTSAEYGNFWKTNASSGSQAISNASKPYGEARPGLERLPQAEPASLSKGGAFGAAAAGSIALVRGAIDGNLTTGEVAKQTAVGAGVGVAQTAGERVVTPLVDRAVGQTVQRVATSAATSVSSTLAPESAAAFGAGARTLAARVGGSTAVGAVIATGISAYENRDGLAHGDSKAIGNVAADATVAVGSIAAATATGAAIGSVVPIAGTAVGAVVGLAVGVGVAYGAQLSGVRDAIAGGVSSAVDWVKSWF